MKSGHAVSIVALILGPAIAVGVLSTQRSKAEAAERVTRAEEVALGARVQVARVVRSPDFHVVTLPGEVRPFRQATLYAKTSGYLREVKVERGDAVVAGQVLGILESPETEHELSARRADSRTSRASNSGIEFSPKRASSPPRTWSALRPSFDCRLRALAHRSAA